jgi:hypothetical protein
MMPPWDVDPKVFDFGNALRPFFFAILELIAGAHSAALGAFRFAKLLTSYQPSGSFFLLIA